MSIAHEGKHRIPPSTLGSRLRDARLWRKLEQETIAEALDVSRATVSNYERGVTYPSKLQVAAWAAVTDVEVDWLRTGAVPEDGPAPGDGVVSSAAIHAALAQSAERFTRNDESPVIDMFRWAA